MWITIPTFFTAALKVIVQMNGVFVRFDRCIENLQRFCRPVMFHNEDPLYEASQPARGPTLSIATALAVAGTLDGRDR